MMQWIAFLFFASMTLLSALGVVLLPNIIYVILSLLSTLVMVAGIFFVAGAELVGSFATSHLCGCHSSFLRTGANRGTLGESP
jgi:NADH:ubiquinone oxidoreductase subunit 6 (subunit J)